MTSLANRPPLHIDFETRSTCPLDKCGVHVYAAHPTTDTWCAAFALGDDPIESWLPGEPVPPEIVEQVKSGGEFWAHNAPFERLIWQHILGPRYGWPTPAFDRWQCTMARACVMALPSSLKDASAALGLDQAKDDDGHRLMMQMSKPRGYNADGGPIWWDTPDRLRRLVKYNKQDVAVERALHGRVNDLRPLEHLIWLLDQRINDRGLKVDRELCAIIQPLIEKSLQELNREIRAITGGAVASVYNVASLAQYCRSQGVETDSVAAHVLEEMLLRSTLPPAVRRVLEIRAEASKASVKKIEALLRGCSSDGRARGLLAYHIASTGRWAGRRFQPQNIKRPVNHDQDTLIDLLRQGSLSSIRLLAGEPLEVIGDVLRGLIVAAPGHTFFAGDFSAIESRVLAWLAVESWKLKAFREDEDIYVLLYKRAFHVREVDSNQRQVGKVMDLACLGADTQVVTDNGIKRIIDVTINDKVWDGVEWVSHKGLVAKGVRPVVSVGDTSLTPDHLIFTGTSWESAQQLVSDQSILHRSLAVGLASLPSSATIRTECLQSRFSAAAAQIRTMCTAPIFARDDRHGAMPAPKRRLDTGPRNTTGTLTLFPMTSTGVACLTGLVPASIGVALPTIPLITATVAVASMSSNLGTIAARFLHTLSRCPDGIRQSLNSIGSMSTRDTSRATSVLSRDPRTSVDDEQSDSCRPASTSSRPVFDLAHAGPRNRFTIVTSLGPLLVHNCGYQGSVGAFQSMASGYRVKISDVRAKELVTAWREAHPNTVNLWFDVERAAIHACAHPGLKVTVGKLAFRRDGPFLYMKLPSGRLLTYPFAKLMMRPTPWGEDKRTLTHKSVVHSARQVVPEEGNSSSWARVATYGGSLVENAVQAIARDLLAEAMLRIEAAGFPIVLTVHDEVVSEAPVDRSLDEFKRLLIEVPDWAKGLPISAKAWSGPRYRKD